MLASSLNPLATFFMALNVFDTHIKNQQSYKKSSSLNDIS